jgi:16S rRNA (guanine527-N7)-methyltransferase
MSLNRENILGRLTQGIETLGLKLSAEQIEQLVELQAQLMKWTKAFNLTAITDENEILKLHLLDSLAVVPYWNGNNKNGKKINKTLDVGTGAGFPGLPLAIALPDQEFHLLDSNSKKIRFIRQQIHHLGLKNVQVFHSRVQEHQITDYDCVVSRAFASISDMVEMTKTLINEGGCWMAMKAQYSDEEKLELPDWIEEVSAHQLTIPWLSAQRCLIELVKRND